MPEELTNETPQFPPGQAYDGTQGTETTAQAPEDPQGGQSEVASAAETTDPGPPPAAAEDSFFDPRDIQDKPELQSAYKQMQSAFSKKMQAIAADRQKIEAFDAFSQDPLTQLQQMAGRMGYQLTSAQAQQISNQAQQQQTAEDNDPGTWDEVYKTAEERAYNRVKQEFAPMLQEFQNMRKTTIEKQLSEIDPTWQQYEEAMMDTLKAHPSMAQDPAMLYRMSVPPDVIESRATQAALRRLQKKTAAAKTSGVSTTKPKTTGVDPGKPLSFTDAVAFAKKSLAERGVNAPGR